MSGWRRCFWRDAEKEVRAWLRKDKNMVKRPKVWSWNYMSYTERAMCRQTKWQHCWNHLTFTLPVSKKIYYKWWKWKIILKHIRLWNNCQLQEGFMGLQRVTHQAASLFRFKQIKWVQYKMHWNPHKWIHECWYLQLILFRTTGNYFKWTGFTKKQRGKTKLRQGLYYASLFVNAHPSKSTSWPFGALSVKISTAFASPIHLTANMVYWSAQ